jgi:hypothetical protein
VKSPKAVANWVINNLKAKLTETGTVLADVKIAPSDAIEKVLSLGVETVQGTDAGRSADALRLYEGELRIQKAANGPDAAATTAAIPGSPTPCAQSSASRADAPQSGGRMCAARARISRWRHGMPE